MKTMKVTESPPRNENNLGGEKIYKKRYLIKSSFDRKFPNYLPYLSKTKVSIYK